MWEFLTFVGQTMVAAFGPGSLLLLGATVYQSWRLVVRDQRDEANRAQAKIEADARSTAFARMSGALETMEHAISNISLSQARVEGILSQR